MKNTFITTLLLLWLCGSGCNQATSNVETSLVTNDSMQVNAVIPDKELKHYNDLLSSFFDSMLMRRGFSGGILVARNGQIVYESYAGFTDPARKQAMTDSSSLHIASTSKTFMGIAVLRLVQDGLLSLNDSLQKFFPKLPYPGVTVKMLLNHRSGMPNYLYFMSEGKWDKTQQVTNKDVLNALYTEKPARTSMPGMRFSYSNTNFVLLALIVEQLMKMPFPEYMHQRYFEPLKMTHTFVYSLTDTHTVSPSYMNNGRIWDNDFLEGTYGDKNIYSTPRDLLKWDQALYTESLLSKQLLDSAFMPYSNERPSVHNYGLGFRMLNLPNGKKVIYHFGRWHGFNAAFARLTDEKTTIIILGNKYNRGIYSTANKCYDLFGNYLQGGADEEETESAEPVKKAAAPPKKPAVANKKSVVKKTVRKH